MKKLLPLLLLVAVASARAQAPAENGETKLRLLKPPKGVTLNAEQRAMLDRANAAIRRGHDLLMHKHDPGGAVVELRKALAIRNKLLELKPEKQPAGKGQESSLPGTPEDEIEFAGGIETILEIAETGGMSAAPDVDSGLHKRKLAKLAENEAKKLRAKQERLTQDIQAEAGGGGAGGGEAQQQPGQQQPGQQQGGQPGKPQPGQQQGGQPGKPQPGKQQGGQPGKQQPGQPPQGTGASSGQGQAGALAGRQEAIRQGLDRVATQLSRAGGEGGELKQAAKAFRQAAGEAGRTAQQIRRGDLTEATAGSRRVERAIRAALAQAGVAGTDTLAEALSAVERRIAGLQTKQENLLGQTKQIGRTAGGGTASQRTRRERARGLAGEQAKVKPRIEGLQAAIGALAASAGGENPAARTAENAAREELSAAAAGLRNGRPDQAVVNAAVRLAQGDAPGAMKAMAQVQSALNAARQRVTAADAALAGDSARLARALRSIRQLAGDARRLERTAQLAAGQPAQGNHPGGAQTAGRPGQQGTGGRPSGTTTGGKTGPPPKPAGNNPPSASRRPPTGVSPSWGQVLNRSARQLGKEATRTVQRLRLPSIVPLPSQALLKAASKAPAFGRDFTGSLSQVRSLLAALEGIEAELQRKVGQEAENKALRNYSKERIPSAYRKAVAKYYEELSKGGGK